MLPPPSEAALLLYVELGLLALVRSEKRFSLPILGVDGFMIEVGLALVVAIAYGALLGTERYRDAGPLARVAATLAGAFSVLVVPAFLAETPEAYRAFGPGLALVLISASACLSTGWIIELGRVRRARAAVLLRFSRAAVDTSLGAALRVLEAAEVALRFRRSRLSPERQAQLVRTIDELKRHADGQPDPRRLTVAIDRLAEQLMEEGGPWSTRDRS
jgi:hypothetical protein